MNARPRAAAAAAACALATVLALAGCGGGAPAPPPRPTELATVEVGGAPDAGATTAGDAVEVRRAAAASSGELPEGFPREVPLPAGGGLVDFGPAPGGAWIELVVAQGPAEVKSAYARRLAAAGFAAAADGSFRRGSLVVAVSFTPRGAGTTVRVEPRAR